jgi:hypothetical protein
MRATSQKANAGGDFRFLVPLSGSFGKVHMDLIVKVEIDRRISRSRYERNKMTDLIRASNTQNLPSGANGQSYTLRGF